MEKLNILIADDDPAILKLLSSNLRARGYQVTPAINGREALENLDKDFVDLVILDIGMPEVDGIEVCRRIREWSQVPIIMLSARVGDDDKVGCLELGADDYLTKPFSIAELLARIKTALRHSNAPRTINHNPGTLALGDIVINFSLRQVTRAGKILRLTSTEYSLLEQLAANANKVLTHTTLLQKVWGQEYAAEREYLHVFVNRLRNKLEPDPRNPRYIITVPGVGYYLAVSGGTPT